MTAFCPRCKRLVPLGLVHGKGAPPIFAGHVLPGAEKLLCSMSLRPLVEAGAVSVEVAPALFGQGPFAWLPVTEWRIT